MHNEKKKKTHTVHLERSVTVRSQVRVKSTIAFLQPTNPIDNVTQP